MKPSHAAMAFACCLLLPCGVAAATDLAGAHYEDPVERYGHFATGKPHEYGRIAATAASGERMVLDLPDDAVFEDIAPRPLHLEPTGDDVVLTIVSDRASGSRLALVGVRDGRLAIVARSMPTGSPNRWVNPVGAGDLDGTGRTLIAAVTTPHVGGTLRVYRRAGDALIEVASLPGFSNHVFGSSELRLSTIGSFDGSLRLIVPDASRHALRIVAWSNERLVDAGRCGLQGMVVGPVRQDSATTITAVLDTGLQRIALADCFNEGLQRPPGVQRSRHRAPHLAGMASSI